MWRKMNCAQCAPTMLAGIPGVQGHGYLPLSDNGRASISGWGGRKQGHLGRGRAGVACL